MPSAAVVNEVAIERTPRVMQLEGLFDLAPSTTIHRQWHIEMPIESRDWSVGIIAGPSGSGKTSIARTLFPDPMKERIVWPRDKSLVDAFPKVMALSDIASILNAVGFSSPPSWLKPHRCLSTGEQFRADLARRIADRVHSCRVGTAHHTGGSWVHACGEAQPSCVGVPRAIARASVMGSQAKDRLTQTRKASKKGKDGMHEVHTLRKTKSRWAEPTLQKHSPLAASRLCVTPSLHIDGDCSPIVVDEFTSSLDRTVARLGSAAVAKAIRSLGLRLIAVSCHDDILDWLDPDWVYRVDAESFAWRSLQGRPRIALNLSPAPRSMWSLFRPHHYLTGKLSPSAHCYVGTVDHRPAVFTAVIHFPHPTRPGWREHRTVCLPDFQGVGLGNAQSDLIAAMYRATGKPYRSVTSALAMIRHRARSENWFMTRKPGQVRSAHRAPTMKRRSAHERLTASFEYVGPPRVNDAKRLGII